MTRFSDDGYLETDDPVVAACFLGCVVMSPRRRRYASDRLPLLSIGCDQVELQTAGEQSASYLYPILVPAVSVAVVCGWFTTDTPNERTVLDIYSGMGWHDIALWIAEHLDIKEGANDYDTE
jgi:hypothetical protein